MNHKEQFDDPKSYLRKIFKAARKISLKPAEKKAGLVMLEKSIHDDEKEDSTNTHPHIEEKEKAYR